MPCSQTISFKNQDGNCEYDYFTDIAKGNPLVCNLSTEQNITGYSSFQSPGPKGMAYVATLKDKAYLIGGYDGSHAADTVYVNDRDINGNFDHSSWKPHNSLPVGNMYGNICVTSTRVYVLGGYNSNDVYVKTVYYAEFDSDGVLGDWIQDADLVENSAYSSLFVTKSKIYIAGGHNGSGYHDRIMSASILQDGSIGTWSQDGNLAQTLAYSRPIITKSRIYLLGGHDGGNWRNKVQYSDIQQDGTLGTWTISNSMMTEVTGSGSVAYWKNRVYYFGGYIGSYSNHVQYADIDDNGFMSDFIQIDNMPNINYLGSLLVSEHRIDIIGGYNGSSWSTDSMSIDIEYGWKHYSSSYEVMPFVDYSELVKKPIALVFKALEVSQGNDSSILALIDEMINNPQGINFDEYEIDDIIFRITDIINTQKFDPSLDGEYDQLIDDALLVVGDSDYTDKYLKNAINFLRVAKRLNKIIYPNIANTLSGKKYNY